MRESNFAFPAQNRACVCITSQLYDRRALDTNSPLPLFNSLTHLTYLTSTSPRIREIMTMDGGLERLVRIIHEFTLSPPPPEIVGAFYGLQPPGAQPAKAVPTLIPKGFDRGAQMRFSLALQCVVNIGVRGSEPIRSRVVQAGTLEVVGCILEAWLASKGFAVGPGVGANGMPRETREQRQARRQAQAELRASRTHTEELDRALQRQVALQRRPTTTQEEPMDVEPTHAQASSETDTPTDTPAAATPGSSSSALASSASTGTIRGRSGTLLARSGTLQASSSTHRRSRASAAASASTSAGNSRPETETEDDGDVDMDRESSREVDPPSASGSPSPERPDSSSSNAGTVRAPPNRSRRPVIVGDAAPATGSADLNGDAHIIINEQGGPVDGVVGVNGDDIVSLEQNDDLAMGAPPGAPGAIETPVVRPVTDPPAPGPGERTPRARPANLPLMAPMATAPAQPATRMTAAGPGAGNEPILPRPRPRAAAPREEGPYRDDDVLLSLQLLAYLSKYPYVRQAFYKPRMAFHPATLAHAQAQQGPDPAGKGKAPASPAASPSAVVVGPSGPQKEQNSFLKAIATATGRGKEKEKASGSSGASSSTTAGTPAPGQQQQKMTNVFSLVERFTFRHSSADLDSPSPPPSLPPEIQYWAGVIMRNACRKDDSRGGIRQCANMLCGKWETFPREFAKCRRCRKAKYCGKECQSTAWSEGHRFWCSAKDPEEDGEHHRERAESSRTGAAPGGREQRRAERDRDRQARAIATAAEQRQRERIEALAVRSVAASRQTDAQARAQEAQAQQEATPRVRTMDERWQTAAEEERRQLMHLVEGEHQGGEGAAGPGAVGVPPFGAMEMDTAGEDTMMFD